MIVRIKLNKRQDRILELEAEEKNLTEQLEKLSFLEENLGIQNKLEEEFDLIEKEIKLILLEIDINMQALENSDLEKKLEEEKS